MHPCGRWPTTLTKLVSARPQKNPDSKKMVDSARGTIPDAVLWPPHVWEYVYLHIHMCTCTHTERKLKLILGCSHSAH